MGKFGSPTVTSIVNPYSDGGVLSPQTIPGGYANGYCGKAYLSGALTADTYKELISV